MGDISELNDDASVQALCAVVKTWSVGRGLEALVTATNVGNVSKDVIERAPSWAVGKPKGEPASGAFSRKILTVLLDARDDEVAAWTETAVRDALTKQKQATAQMLDPISLSIFGAIAIGAILAARVKKVGPVDFYEGVPKELGDVIKGVASLS